MGDHETFVNINLQPRATYDNPPSDGEEQYPILANRSTDVTYTTNHIQDQEEENEALDIPQQMPRYPFSQLFSVSVYILEILGLFCIALLITWLVVYHGGFAWDIKTREFNWHPLFMVIGLVFFYGNAAISSYVTREKHTTKIHYFHGISIVMTLLFTFIGFIVGLQVDRQFFTFHTWLGMATLFCLFVQSLVGLVGLFIKCETGMKKRFLKFQIWIFLCVFICSILTCILGIVDYVHSNSSIDRHDFSMEGLMTNFICLLLVLFGILVSSMLIDPKYMKI